MVSTGRRPLWTCPKCGAKLVSRNLAHSCGNATLADWLNRLGPDGRRFYHGFEALIAQCGPYHIAPAQTRIAFMGRVRFAGITALSERGMTCSFSLPSPLASPRFERVYEVAPGWWLHRLRITKIGQLDRELLRWLRKSYRLMGMQERLTGGRRSVPAVSSGRGR